VSDARWEQAQRLHASRLFGTRSAEHAYALILLGDEIGVGPTTSLTQIAVIQGKPAFGAALVGALVKKSGRYDYEVTEMSDQAVTVRFTERVRAPGGTSGDGVTARVLGDSRFTLQDAQRAGLGASPTWQRFPRNLLLARALTNGARWYCPDILAGAAYTPDELESGVARTITDVEAGPLPGEEITLEELLERYGMDAILEVTGASVPASAEEVHEAALELSRREAAGAETLPDAAATEAPG
jgi:hypothetical protein